MIFTTLNKIRECGLSQEGWAKLLKHLGKTTGDDEPLALATILESNGLDYALWCMRSVPEESRRLRLLAVRCARTVQHLMTDQRSLAALDVAERHARGEASDGELSAACDAACDAAWAAAWVAACDATRGAARAACRATACDASAPGDCAVAAARAAAWAIVRDPSAPGDSAAWATACDAAYKTMEGIFLGILDEEIK